MSRLLSICTALAASFALVACGGASTTAGGDAFSSGSATDVVELSFGSADAGANGLTTDAVVVRIVNYSNLLILDAGIRAFGSTGAYQGGLSGHDPASYGNANQGGAFWVSLTAGNYEGFLDTDQGMLHFTGYVPVVQLPDGSYTAGPADLYLFSLDTPGAAGGGDGSLPGGGGPVPGGGGGVTPGGGI